VISITTTNNDDNDDEKRFIFLFHASFFEQQLDDSTTTELETLSESFARFSRNLHKSQPEEGSLKALEEFFQYSELHKQSFCKLHRRRRRIAAYIRATSCVCVRD